MARVLDRIRWRLRMLRLGWTLPPIAGAEDPPADPAPKDDPPKDDPPADPPKDDPPKVDPAKVEPDDDWRTKSRKNETRAKKAEREAAELREKLQKIEDSNKSETEKAIEKAKEEARSEALKEADTERRSDRLEVSVTRLSTRGFKIGEGDDEKTLRFADPDDAIVHVERAISKGEIDGDDIFDSEGKVNSESLTTALADLLERKPHLAANGDGPAPPKGDPGTRRGEPADNDLESMSIEDHEKRKYGAASK